MGSRPYHGAMLNPELLQPYRSEGGPVGVLLLHGFTGSPAAMRPLAQALAAAGHTVSVPRLPGHGTRWQELAVTGWVDWYGAADRAYRDLEATCEQVFVCGLSMGGTLALRVAQHHPSVAGLVLVNPGFGSTDPRARFAHLLKHVVRTTRSIGQDISRPGQDEGSYETVPSAAVVELFRLFADVRSMLDLVTCPVLVFRSRIDHTVPASSTELILRQVSSRDVREVVLERSFHVATLDWDADAITRGTLDFVARLTRA